MEQACSKVVADKSEPLAAHLAEMGWAAVQQCLGQLCQQLHCPATWMVEQETFEAMPRSCYTDGDPISSLPIALWARLTAVTDTLGSVVASAVRASPRAAP
eukprot:scaffold147612_cov39-Prasinocladus_malaysianus.AAC.3